MFSDLATLKDQADEKKLVGDDDLRRLSASSTCHDFNTHYQKARPLTKRVLFVHFLLMP